MSAHSLFQEAHANRNLMTGVLLTEVETLVAPLRLLDERTRASIMVLVGLAELVTASARDRQAGADAGIGNEFIRGLKALHGDGARLLADLRTVTEDAAPADSPLDALTDVMRCLGLPAPVPYERRRRLLAACEKAAA